MQLAVVLSGAVAVAQAAGLRVIRLPCDDLHPGQGRRDGARLRRMLPRATS